ncbi:hypothetical protein ACFOY2_29110 [Nonomuraea purpurea]|uniref:Guanylate cyclase domain-containing protein n=1 Tax=Nonomuraea purpurea TaxID=1849276 RepID=A0ABV8GEI6_9ACTN
MTINTARHWLLAIDVVGYGKGDDQRHRSIQRVLLELLNEAADAAVLHRKRWTIQSTGDGELAIIPLTESERRLVDEFIRHLDRLLTQHNAWHIEAARLRLRVAVHVGVVGPGDNGYTGQAVVQVKRLLECGALRKAVEAAPEANIVLVVSDEIHRGMISQGYTTYRSDDFRRVRVGLKEYRGQAWIHVVAGKATTSGYHQGTS